VFVIDARAGREDAVPLLLVHGFPTSSFDWRHVLPLLGAQRRVVMLDLLGFGLSDKPDRAYSLFEQADLVEAVTVALGVEQAALVTHDMGDSVGGELLARSLEASLGFEVTARVITNGSIYMDLVQLSAGQQLLLALPDRRLQDHEALDRSLFAAGIPPLFGPATQPEDAELGAMWALLTRSGGDRLLPRTIRYIEQRRVHEHRWTGAIEKHPSPLTIAWGDADPIAVYPMAERLAAAAGGSSLVRLERIGHFPMIETPERLADIISTATA
jgi:pimeloyl-ACP methyl ester carboxylesterase